MPFVEDENIRAVIMRAAFGRGYAFWSAVIQLQRDRLEGLLRQVDGRDRVRSLPELIQQGSWLHAWQLQALADSHFLLVSVRHVLRHGRALRKLVDHIDPRPREAIAAFLSGSGREAEKVRGVLEHWDEYSLDRKDYPRGMERPENEIAGQASVSPVDHDLVMNLAGLEFHLLDLAGEALVLVQTLDRVWIESITPPAR